MLRIARALCRYAAAASLAAALLPEASTAEAAEAYADLPVGRVFYLDSGGGGAAVVFLHARSGNSLLFEKQVEPFSRAGLSARRFRPRRPRPLDAREHAVCRRAA